MSRTFLRQETQIRQSDVYDDTVTPSLANFETNPTNIETDLNNVRSAIKTIIGKTDWYSVADRSMEGLDTDLADMEGKKVLGRVSLLTDITVTAAQNFELLVAASSETPTLVAAVGANTLGAVVAQSALNGAGFLVHELIEVAGPNAIAPKNLLVIRDSTTGQPIQTSTGKDIFGLLQYESTGADGAAFNDTSAGARAKISFVIQNAGWDDLIACPVGDIAGKTINYSYVQRTTLDALAEDVFLGTATFTDVSTAVDVTRQNAYNNQGTTPVELANNADLDLATGIEWSIRDDANADLLRVIEGSGGGTTKVQIHSDVDLFDVDAVDVNFSAGIKANTGGTQIDIGVTAGKITSASSMSVETTGGAADLTLKAGLELFLDDANQTGSTWAQTGGIKLSETTAEWDAFEANFGEVSILNALNQAYASAGVVKVYSNVTVTTNADNDVSLSDANLDATLGDLSGGDFVLDHDVFLNGQLLRSGANAAANHDVYPGTDLSIGQLKFEFRVKQNDVLCVMSRA